MFLNSTSYQNVCFFFWQCTALKSMPPLSRVTFSSCCNAQPPLLNKRQQNVHRINLHMLSFITKNKQTNKRKYLDTLKSVQSSIMKHCVCYIHTVNTSWYISICTVCELDDYTLIFMCSAVIQTAWEHHNREIKALQRFFMPNNIVKRRTWLQIPAWWWTIKRNKPGRN